jgi:hypothetical protein
MESNNPGIISKFYEAVKNHLLQLPHDTTPIIGGNFNASIGIHDPNAPENVIGSYSLHHSTVLVRNFLTWCAIAAYKQVLLTSNTTPTRLFRTSETMVLPNNLTSSSSTNAMDHTSPMLVYANPDSMLYPTIMQPALNSALPDTYQKANG